MFNQRSPAFLFDPTLAAKIRLLIFGRLALISLIVLAGWWWTQNESMPAMLTTPGGLFLLLAVSIVLSVIYLFWLGFGRTLLWQGRVQFLIDTLLITWLVWETGDLISPYVTLYVILISLAGSFLGKTDAIIVAGACAVCFTILPFATTQFLVYSITGAVAPSRTVQIVAINDVAFLIVGLLAARIADRRKIGEKLKEAEANFADLSVLHERILASINSGLITTDLQGKIYAFNRAAEVIAGLAAADAIGRSVFSIFGDDIRQPIEQCLGGAQSIEFSPPNFEAKIRSDTLNDNAPGQVTVACTVLPLAGGAGGIHGLIVAFQDTTKMRAMEESLRQSDRLAAVGRMAAGLAHEIRNPLGSMSSALQFLAEKKNPDAKDTALMGVVLRESDRLNRIITDFLAYARPEHSGEVARGSVQMNLSEAIIDCLALIRHDPGVHDGHVFEFAPPEEPVLIHADETQIKQILWNLFQNSIQAMPDGGRLAVDLSESNEINVRMIISDTGCGINPEDSERIFEPFQSRSKGTGLGLSIVHRIVTQIGGRLSVKSRIGEGTRITVELPRTP